MTADLNLDNVSTTDPEVLSALALNAMQDRLSRLTALLFSGGALLDQLGPSHAASPTRVRCSGDLEHLRLLVEMATELTVKISSELDSPWTSARGSLQDQLRPLRGPLARLAALLVAGQALFDQLEFLNDLEHFSQLVDMAAELTSEISSSLDELLACATERVGRMDDRSAEVLAGSWVGETSTSASGSGSSRPQELGQAPGSTARGWPLTNRCRATDAPMLFDSLLPRAFARVTSLHLLPTASYHFKVIGDASGPAGEWLIDCTVVPPTCARVVGAARPVMHSVEVSHEALGLLLDKPDLDMCMYYSGKLRLSGDPMSMFKFRQLFELVAAFPAFKDAHA